MKKITYLLCVIIVILCLFCDVMYSSTNNAEGQLRYAAVLYRHGDRTPVETYPLDPWKNESLWPVKFGQLTNTGKMQHFKFGQFLRNRYMNLISPHYDPAEVYVRSSDVDRTLMSAQCNLAGLYPPVTKSVWNPDLAWQPVPVHTTPQKEDEIIAMEKPCPKYDKELEQVKRDPAYREKLNQYKSVMDYLSNHSGRTVNDYYGILSIFTTLKIEEEYKFKLPEWTQAVYPHKMVTPAGYSFEVNTLTRRLARLKIGPFIKELTSNMLKVMHTDNSKIPGHTIKYDDVDGVEPLKMHIYSAHDLNIGSILNGLGLYDGKCPVYTSAILFELHYDPTAEAHLVKIFYRNTTDIQEPSQLYIPKCGLTCPLDQFVMFYKDLIPDDWEKECNPKIYLFPLVFVLMIVGALIMYVLHKLMISQLTIKFQKQCNRDIYEIFVASVNAQEPQRLRGE